MMKQKKASTRVCPILSEIAIESLRIGRTVIARRNSFCGRLITDSSSNNKISFASTQTQGKRRCCALTQLIYGPDNSRGPPSAYALTTTHLLISLQIRHKYPSSETRTLLRKLRAIV